MIDDFAPNRSTSGAYRINSAPLIVNSVLSNDDDWIRLTGLKTYFDYDLLVYLAPSPLPRIDDAVSLKMYGLTGDSFFQQTAVFRSTTPYHHQRGSSDHFVSLTTSPASGSSAGYYRFYVGVADRVGDSNAAASHYRQNWANRMYGSLSHAGDKDVFSVTLRAGVEYVFDLQGIASNDLLRTTLGNPFLRLVTEHQTVAASDDNSGTGSNARLSFTPDLTQQYYLHVLGRSTTGSYSLGSDQLDDFYESIHTKGLFFANGGPVTGRIDFAGDRDWIRFQFNEGEQYQLKSPDAERMYLLDSSGTFIANSLSGLPSVGIQYSSDSDQNVYVFISGSRDDDNEYSLIVNSVDKYGDDFDGAHPFTQTTFLGAIQTTDDLDFFSIGILRYANYELSVVGHGHAAIGDLKVRRFDSNREFVESSNGMLAISTNEEPSGASRFHTQNWLEVSGVAGATGSYSISLRLLDTPGSISTDRNVEFASGVGLIQDAIEFPDDVDFHRIAAKANTWYQFQRLGFRSEGSVVDASGNQVELMSYNSGQYMYVEKASVLYVRVEHQADIFSYDVEVFEGDQPKLPSATQTQRALALSEQEFAPSSVANLYTANHVEVFSTVPLLVPGRAPLPLNQAVRLTIQQWTDARVASGYVGPGSVFARSVLGDTNKLPWTHTAIVGRFPPQDIIRADYEEFNLARFAFATGLPDDYVADPGFADVAPLDATEQTMVAEAFKRWNLARGGQYLVIDPGVGNSDGDIMVYKADLGDEVVATFAHGESTDIILNSTSNLFDGSLKGEGLFEILRSVGLSIRLKETEAFGRDVSVMGSRDGEYDEVVPTFPLPADIAAVSRRQTLDFNATSSVYLLGGAESFTQTLFAASSFVLNVGFSHHTVSAEDATAPVSISLLRGDKSVRREDGLVFVFHNSPYTVINDGIAGAGDDGLTGNEYANVLEGRAGNDVLRGMAGNDVLMGGAGNDYYRFGPGSEHDTINEQDAGGIDVIRIEGMYDYNRLDQDLTFQRLGNDLVVRLELNGRPDQTGDSITIKNMGTESSRVEALTLLNPAGAVVRISLASVWEQAGSERTRFGLAPGKDAFGVLVNPI